MKNLMVFRPLAWQKFDFLKAAFFVLCLFVAIFFGLASAFLPPMYLLIFVSIPVAFILAAAFPALALSTVLVIAFGLLPQFIFGALPLGGARLQPAELMLMLTFGVLLLRGNELWQSALKPAKSLLIPFFLLAIGIAIGFFKGKILAHYQYAGADFRQYIGWLALPVALWLTKRYPGSVHRVILSVAIVAAAAMLFQMITGIQVIYGFRGAEDLSKEFSDVKRSALGGGEVFLVYAAYYLFAYFCESDRLRSTAFIGLLVVLGGLVASFSRGVWGGLFVGGVFFLAITPSFKRSKGFMAVVMIALAIVFGTVLSMSIPRVGDAMVDRVLSISNEGGKGSSVGFRIDENQQAWQAIQHSPVLGAGLGAEYKTTFRQAQIGGGFDTEGSFIHNAYVGIWLKLGAFGAVFPFLLMFILWHMVKNPPKSSKAKKRLNGVDNANAYAAFCSLVSFSIFGLTAPVWSTFITIVAASCLIALVCTGNRVESGQA